MSQQIISTFHLLCFFSKNILKKKKSSVDEFGRQIETLVVGGGRLLREEDVGESKGVPSKRHLGVAPKVVTGTVEGKVAVHRLEYGPKPASQHPHLYHGVLPKHAVTFRKRAVRVLPDPQFNGHQAAGTVVVVRLRPRTGAVLLNLVGVDPLLDGVQIKGYIETVRSILPRIHSYHTPKVGPRYQAQRLAVHFRPFSKTNKKTQNITIIIDGNDQCRGVHLAQSRQ